MRTRGSGGTDLGYWDGGQDGQATKEPPGTAGGPASTSSRRGRRRRRRHPRSGQPDQVRFERQDGPRYRGGWVVRPLTEVPPLISARPCGTSTSSSASPPSPRTPRGSTAVPTLPGLLAARSFGSSGAAQTAGRRSSGWCRGRGSPTGSRSPTGSSWSRRPADLQDPPRCREHPHGPNDDLPLHRAARGTEAAKVYLPFEEDGGKLAVILSKAFLVAADSSITTRASFARSPSADPRERRTRGDQTA